MAILALGVLDVAYVGGNGDQETTGDVAEILEKEYGVMEVFFEAKKDKVIGAVNDSLAHQIEALSQGAPLPFGGDIFLPEVESLFRDFVTTREIEGITGQTEAARLGISHRFKNAQNKTVSPQDVVAGKGGAVKSVAVASRGSRPSFVDTGLYVASMKAWLHP